MTCHPLSHVIHYEKRSTFPILLYLFSTCQLATASAQYIYSINLFFSSFYSVFFFCAFSFHVDGFVAIIFVTLCFVKSVFFSANITSHRVGFFVYIALHVLLISISFALAPLPWIIWIAPESFFCGCNFNSLSQPGYEDRYNIELCYEK